MLACQDLGIRPRKVTFSLNDKLWQRWNRPEETNLSSSCFFPLTLDLRGRDEKINLQGGRIGKDISFNRAGLSGISKHYCTIHMYYLCFSLLKSVQEFQIGHITFVVGINHGHQLMKLLLAHSKTEAFQHASKIPFGDTPISILQRKQLL